MGKERIWYLMTRKLGGEANAQELVELENLLRNDPDLHYSLQTVTELWELPAKKPRSDSSTAFQNHIKRLQEAGLDWEQELPGQPENPETAEPAGTSKRLNRPVVAGLILLLAVLGGWWLISGSIGKAHASDQQLAARVGKSTQPSPVRNEISTRNGSRTKIVLPDGSQVWLNAGSQLKYPANFGSDLREVELSGEGFFDVVKNPKKPFVIHTSVLDIKVLGTQFNVKSYPSDKTTETSLFRGKVEVMLKKRPEERFVLKPNEKLVVLNDEPSSLLKTLGEKPVEKDIKEPLVAIRNLTYQPGDSTAVEEAWTHNKLSFEDETFEEVAKKMERWYDVKFEFRNTALLGIHMNGSFTNESLQQAMEALQYSVRFHYQIRDGKVTIY